MSLKKHPIYTKIPLKPTKIHHTIKLVYFIIFSFTIFMKKEWEIQLVHLLFRLFIADSYLWLTSLNPPLLLCSLKLTPPPPPVPPIPPPHLIAPSFYFPKMYMYRL